MSSQSGDAVSQNFLAELRSLTNDSDSALVIDSTETGAGASGNSYWGFTGESDYLVFGKRTQVEGFYSTPMSKAASISHGCDHLSLLQFQVINEVIQKDRLIDKVNRVGQSFKAEVEKSANGKKGVTGVRGQGTQLFIDTVDEQTAQELHYHLIQEGVLTKLNGARGIALKPALIFEEKHVEQFTNAFAKF